jgi:large-conductance mechanosensitive channel
MSFSPFVDGITGFFDMQHFGDFVVQHGIVSTTAAWIIAYAAWEFIKSFVGDLFLPGLYFTVIFPFVGEKSNWHSVVFAPMEKLDIPNFLKNFISFFIVLFLTYYLIQNVMSHLIAVKPTPVQVEEKPVEAKPVDIPDNQVRGALQGIGPTPLPSAIPVSWGLDKKITGLIV